MPAPHLFVIGAAFSGATTLAWALGRHPSLRPVVGSSGAGRLTAALRLVEEELLPLLGRDELGSLFGGRAERDTSWVVSAPGIAGRLGVAKMLFPELRVVHVHRDAAAVVPKLTEAAVRDGAHLTRGGAEQIWRRTVDECLVAEDIAGADRVLRLSWEELVVDPDGSLRRSLDLIGIEPHPHCLWPLRLLTTAQVDRPGSPHPRRRRRPGTGGEPGDRLRTRRLRRLVESVVPAGASVLVASRGDDELLRFRDREGAHFPQLDDGSWAGFYPATGADAIAQVDMLTRRGATHLLFPREALWWLDHYRELRDQLERSARLLAFDLEVGVVWELDPRRRLVLPAVIEASPRRPEEPDNARAFASTGTVVPGQRKKTLGGSLWAVTTFFNPACYASKKANYERFRADLARVGIPLLTVELAFDDTPFELGPDHAERLVQLRGGDILWQKERLLNLGIRHLPADCDKVAWLDADVLIARPDWAAETSRLLERHVVVQPFSHCVRLPEGASTCEPATLPFGPGEGELFYGIAWGVQAHGRRSLRRYGDHGHTGFAWAARRQLLERHTLYDANLLGNADTDIAHAMFGSRSYWGLQKLGDQARAHLRRWAEPFAADVGRSVAYLDGVLTHLWHGRQEHRLYDRPLDVLGDFDPDRDLAVGADGLYRWADASSTLRDWSRGYFADRREDG